MMQFQLRSAPQKIIEIGKLISKSSFKAVCRLNNEKLTLSPADGFAKQ